MSGTKHERKQENMSGAVVCFLCRLWWCGGFSPFPLSLLSDEGGETKNEGPSAAGNAPVLVLPSRAWCCWISLTFERGRPSLRTFQPSLRTTTRPPPPPPLLNPENGRRLEVGGTRMEMRLERASRKGQAPLQGGYAVPCKPNWKHPNDCISCPVPRSRSPRPLFYSADTLCSPTRRRKEHRPSAASRMHPPCCFQSTSAP